MKHTPHVRPMTKPSMAVLEPVWELIYLLQAILGLSSSFLGQGGQFLSLFKGA